MDSSLVIKVKHDDTLRRFSACVTENNQLDLDMVGLRAKICSLFNFTADANVVLRYIDEDGDLVTLVDDDDLHDIMRQRLPFLRIDVHMSNGSGGKPISSSSVNPTPLRSPHVTDPFRSGNDAVADVWKSAQEPLVSKAVSSENPVFAKLADTSSKVGKPIPKSHSQPSVATGPSTQKCTPREHAIPKSKGQQSTQVNDSFAQKGKNSGTHEGKNSWIFSKSAPPNNGSDWTNSNAYIKIPAFPCHSTALFGECSGTSSSTDPADSSNSTCSTAVVKSPIYTDDLGAPSSRTLYINTSGPAMPPSGIIHRGVQCDGCGIYPIVGSRFNSKVKENYDLCSICFNTMGNVADYSRIDDLHPQYLSALAQTSKLARPKLNSQFIMDVKVIDGTRLAPSTVFTKIWRIRNNGTLVWPIGTQLLWIGGDNFSDSHLVDLQVPKEGVPVDKELDIAVDFIAPRLPGLYVSYWRMASPSGQKFGQCVWVLIQVDDSMKESLYDRSQGLKLNIPLDVSGSKGPQLIDINVQPTEDHIPEPVNEMVDNQLMMQELLNYLNGATDAAASAPATLAAAPSAPATSAAAAAASVPTIALSSVIYPNIHLSETAPAVPSSQQSAAVDLPSFSFGVGVNNSVEETLLKQLEEMGFKEVDLNREILRMNEYNLEPSVDYLCGVYAWEPFLGELHETISDMQI